MASGDVRAARDILQGLAHHLNCLHEDDKSTRKRAVEQIKRETVDKGLSSSILQEVFSALLKPLLKCLSDPNEGCRGAAIAALTEFIRCVPKPEESLPYIMPCLARRLGEKEILEHSEELRLSLAEMLTMTVEVCGKHLAPYLHEMIKILQRAIVDPFPDVKRESCKCTVKVAESVPDHFDMQADKLVNPLMQTISHQQSRVRVSTIEATGAVIQHGSGKNLEDVLYHMAQRLFDDSSQVRKAVAAVIGNWLLHFRDRYSYFHKLVPLLLSCINDEIPEIRHLTAKSWEQIGVQWEGEHAKELKDKLDFLLTPPPFYPDGVQRPGLGCRELVNRNLSFLVSSLTRDITDWRVATRVKTSQLLCVLLLHAESHSTQHLQPLLVSLYRACADTEREVVKNCLAAAKLLGTFVPPATFLKLLLDNVTTPYSFSHPWAPLMVLAAVLGGSSRPLLKPHLKQIANTLAQPDVCQEYQQVEYVRQLLACVDVLLHRCESDCGLVSLQLLQVLVTVQSLSADTDLSEKALECVHCLCKVQCLNSVVELYRQHMCLLLDWLSASVDNWSSYSLERTQLNIIVVQSGPAIGEFVSQLMPILYNCLQPQKDPEMRLSIFTTIAKLLLDAANTLDSQGNFRVVSEKFLHDILLPSLVWQAGRTAAALRTSALSCVLALLHGGAISPGPLLGLEEQLRPRMLLALEEDSQMSKLLACRSVSTILRLVGNNLKPEAINEIYPKLLKRLDDSSEDVRDAALQALEQWLSNLNKDYSVELFAPHLQLLFQQLLIHLDDPKVSVQDKVFEILKKGSSVHPALLKKEVEGVREKLRSPVYCDRLLQQIRPLLTENTASCPE